MENTIYIVMMKWGDGAKEPVSAYVDRAEAEERCRARRPELERACPGIEFFVEPVSLYSRRRRKAA